MTIYLTPFSRVGNREALAPSADSGYKSIDEAIIETGIPPESVSRTSATIYTSDTEGLFFSTYQVKVERDG